MRRTHYLSGDRMPDRDPMPAVARCPEYVRRRLKKLRRASMNVTRYARIAEQIEIINTIVRDVRWRGGKDRGVSVHLEISSLANVALEGILLVLTVGGPEATTNI